MGESRLRFLQRKRDNHRGRKPHQHQPLLTGCGSAYTYLGCFMWLTWLSTGACLKARSVSCPTELCTCKLNLSHGCCIAGYVLAQMFHTLDVAFCWYLSSLRGSYRMRAQLLCALVSPIFNLCVWCLCPHCASFTSNSIPFCSGFSSTLTICI